MERGILGEIGHEVGQGGNWLAVNSGETFGEECPPIDVAVSFTEDNEIAIPVRQRRALGERRECGVDAGEDFFAGRHQRSEGRDVSPRRPCG